MFGTGSNLDWSASILSKCSATSQQTFEEHCKARCAHWARAERQNKRWPYIILQRVPNSSKRLQYGMVSGAQAAVSRRTSVIEKLKNAKLPEYTQDSFAASDLLLPSSGRTILTHGTLRMWQSTEGREVVSMVVVKSLDSSYAIHRTRGKEEEDKYRDKLFSYFEREVGIWLRARSHPNITSVCGFIPSYGEKSLPALVFPYYPLENLRLYVDRQATPLSDKSKLLLLCDVAHGLKYLHGLPDPIIHRDLSGSNVLLKETASEIVACINDFGSAKLIDPALNFWQPPEYLKSGTYLESYTNPKPSGDIWSFACVVLEILSESDPWPRSTDVAGELRKGKHPPFPNKEFEKKFGDFLEGCWGWKAGKSWPKLRYTAEKAVSKLDNLIKAEDELPDNGTGHII
ncbi:kinase-like protein [Fomitiporia mediterranea MF3/22]|uniref:kinase-like protein n=1 Tax=Fomitiporia mediterranea (strain MF3/22) TaxID=694068 RepID=UPI00044089BD|nr:kinase-like protein [Fomitiporia mediterranea MF3/22]EJC99790.1 kinase-like protein [Fomitiporia mediterranea MF3/22]